MSTRADEPHAIGPVASTEPALPAEPAGPDRLHRPTDAALAALLSVPGDRDHKYTRGVVEVRAGSGTYPGAAVLTCSGACRAGAGMVRLDAPRRAADLVLARRPEVVPAPGRHQCLVVGPGTDPKADADRLDDALRAACAPRAAEPAPALVVDAGALPRLPALLTQGLVLPPHSVLTPHAGEAAALLTALGRPATRTEAEEPGSAPAVATVLARLTGATVLLKGTPTLVVSSDGGGYALDPGPGWLATAGSGDVLAGVLGALLATTRARDEAAAEGAGQDHADSGTPAVAALAVRVHALAGAYASGTSPAAPSTSCVPPGRPVTALDVAEAVPDAVGHLLSLVRQSRP